MRRKSGIYCPDLPLDFYDAVASQALASAKLRPTNDNAEPLPKCEAQALPQTLFGAPPSPGVDLFTTTTVLEPTKVQTTTQSSSSKDHGPAEGAQLPKGDAPQQPSQPPQQPGGMTLVMVVVVAEVAAAGMDPSLRMGVQTSPAAAWSTS